MKTLKYILLAIVALVGFTACSDDDTESANGINGYGVYFPIDAPAKLKISQGQETVYVPVMRSLSTGELSTRVLFTPGEESADIFTVNPNVHFADGETTAQVEISFSFRDIEAGVPYPMTLSLADGDHSTAYGAAQYTFSILYDPWTLLSEKAIWQDDIIGGMFGFKGFPTTEADLYESPLKKGLYRLGNVYSAEFVAAMVGASPSQVAGNVREGYIIIDASNPDKVIIEPSDIGFMLDPGYGWMSIASLCSEFFDVSPEESQYGTLKDNVITFPKEGLLLNLPDYNGGGWYYTNNSGKTRIVLPGGSVLDPIVEATFEGIYTNVDGDASAIFNAEMNPDAASFRYVMTEGDISEDADTIEEIKAGIVDGTIASKTLNKGGQFLVSLDNAGEFTLVLVPYSADGSIIGTAAAVPFEYTSGGGISPSQFAAEIAVTDIDETMVNIGVTPNADNLLYFWEILPTEEYNSVLAEGYETIGDYFQDYINYLVQVVYPQQGVNVTVAQVVESLAVKGAVEPQLIENLDPDTEYTVFAYCINKSTAAPRSAMSIVTFKTAAVGELDPDYAAWLGTWTVTSTRTEQTEVMQTYEIKVSLKRSNSLLSITGWGQTPVNDNALYAIWQKNKETQQAIIGIPEQATSEQQNTQYGPGTVCFFARCYDTQNGYMAWGSGEDIALYGVLSGDGNGQLIGGSGLLNDNVTEIPFTGADYFLFLNDGSGILAWGRDYAVGPFTLVKKADAAASSKSRAKSGKFSIPTRNLTPHMNVTAKMERAMYMKKMNLVERR